MIFPEASQQVRILFLKFVCDEFLLGLELHYFFFQELVTKVFQQMWFTPLKGEENSDVLVKRVVHMTDVVSVYIRMIKTCLFSLKF